MHFKKAIVGASLLVSVQALAGEHPFVGAGVEQITFHEQGLVKSAFPIAKMNIGSDLSPWLGIQMDLGLPINGNTEGMGTQTVDAGLTTYTGPLEVKTSLKEQLGVFIKPKLSLGGRGSLNLLLGVSYIHYHRELTIKNGTLKTYDSGGALLATVSGVSGSLSSGITRTAPAIGVGLELQPGEGLGVYANVMRYGSRKETDDACVQAAANQYDCGGLAGKTAISGVVMGLKYTF